MRTVAIVQARLGSARFPRKILADLCGTPVIQHVVERARQIPGVDDVVVAVPGEPDLLAVAEVLPDTPVVMFKQVAEADVLRRYAKAAAHYEADVIVRVTADCPLLDPVIGGEVLSMVKAGAGYEYVSNLADGYCDGEDVEAFTRDALDWADLDAKQAWDREHVTPWLRRHVKCGVVLPSVTGKPKTSIDTPEDLARVRQMMLSHV